MQNSKPKAQWRVIETKIKGNVAIEVSELPLQVPRYSFRIGTATVDENTGVLTVGKRLTVFNALDAADLLKEVATKYVDLREARIEEIEQLKTKWTASDES